MKHTIDVTGEDIEIGVPTDPDCCPIAIAATRALGEHGKADMGLLFIGDHGRVTLPLEAMQFMYHFDSMERDAADADGEYQVPMPFSFKVEV